MDKIHVILEKAKALKSYSQKRSIKWLSDETIMKDIKGKLNYQIEFRELMKLFNVIMNYIKIYQITFLHMEISSLFNFQNNYFKAKVVNVYNQYNCNNNLATHIKFNNLIKSG